MPIGQDRVVIKTEDGKEQSFAVRSQARSKLAAIPIGAPAVFLIDETNKISDGTFASVEAAKGAHRQPGGTGEKSNIKGANRQVDGTVVEPLHADRITIKTVDGERPFEVREIMQERLSKLRKGESVILLVDNENKVVDIAVPPASAR
jgi:translation initiation factor IF-1